MHSRWRGRGPRSGEFEMSNVGVSAMAVMSVGTQKKIVAMYLAGEPVASILEATGATNIYGALRKAGIEPGRQPHLRSVEARSARRSEYIEVLRRAAGDLGSDGLSVHDYRRWRFDGGDVAPSENSIIRLFDKSWPAALAAAGLRSTTGKADRDDTWDQGDAVRWMIEAAGDSDVLTVDMYEMWRRLRGAEVRSQSQIHSRFGWADTLQLAGLKNGMGQFSDEELLEALRAAVAGATTLSKRSYDAWRASQSGRIPSSHSISDRLGGWHAACKLIGIEKPVVSDAELLAAIDEVAAELGGRPTQAQYKAWAKQLSSRPRFHVVAKRYSFATGTLRRTPKPAP